MDFNSKEYVPSTGGVGKILKPGEHICRIIDLKLTIPPFNEEAFNIVFVLEGTAEEGEFEGIERDKDNPDAGRYEGKIAYVNGDKFPFSTFTWKGKTIERDEKMFDWINSFAIQLGVFEQIQAASVKAKTIEDYFDKVKSFLINPDLWFKCIIGGREYYKDGYNSPNYHLYFPKRVDGKYAYGVIDDDGNAKKVQTYDESIHIEKAKKPENATDVDEFEAKSEEDDDSPF